MDVRFPRPDLADDLAGPGRSRMEQERLPHGLVVDRRVREANLERPQVSFADREPAADRPKAFRNPFM